MPEPITNATEEVPRCRLCETVLTEAVTVCPKCGLPVRRSPFETPEARPIDVALSILMALIAAVLTVPITASATAVAVSTGRLFDFGNLLPVTCWNCMIVGMPIAILIRRWMARVQRGDFDRSWMWRDYWWFQLLAFSPVVGGFIALLLFSGVMDFVLHLVS